MLFDPRPESTPLEHLDAFRCSSRAPASRNDAAGYKEWHHFIVYAPGLRLLINFNLTEPRFTREGRPSTELSARLIVIAETPGGCGEVEQFAPDQVSVVPATPNARLGDNAMWFADGAYHVRVNLESGAVSACLKLTPITEPVLSNHIQLAPGRELSWLIVPRLEVDGNVRVGGRHMQLERALGYHDHNWGRFNWGDDFAWEWGSIVPHRPSNPWTAVYVRMVNRKRSAVSTQGLLLWRDKRHCRFFRDHEIYVALEGRKSSRLVRRIPRVMALLAPGSCSGVPQRVVAFGSSGSDQLLMTYNTQTVSQVVIPDETATNTATLLNEGCGSVDLSGSVGGRPVDMEGAGVFEFIRT